MDEFRFLEKEGNLTIIDVRTTKETRHGIIDGAIVIDFRSPDFEEQVSELPKDKNYILYCRSGIRSASGCKIMHKQGFTNLYNLKGGYQSWLRSN